MVSAKKKRERRRKRESKVIKEYPVHEWVLCTFQLKRYRMDEIVFFFLNFHNRPFIDCFFFKLRDHKSRKDKKSELYRAV